MRLNQIYKYALLTLLLSVLAVFLIWPIVLIVRGGLVDGDGTWTLRYVMGVFEDPRTIEGIVNSVLIASCTTVLCLVIALPLAVLGARYLFPCKSILTSLMMVPLILPPFVGAIGLRAMLGRFGGLNALLANVGILDPNMPGIDFLGGAVGGRFWGVVLMEALHLYPIMYLNLVAALANLDPTLEEAGQSCGAGWLRRFWDITFPLILPGVFAGSTLVFIWSFTELGTPLMFDFNAVTPVQIFWGLQEVQSSPRPYALVVVMLGMALAMYLLSRMLFGKRMYAMRGKASVASVHRTMPRWGQVAAVSAFVLVTLTAVVPHVGVVLSAFAHEGAWYRSVLPQQWTLSHFENALTHPLAAGSIHNSLIYATGAMLLCVAIGSCAAYLVSRTKIRGLFLLDSLVMLPLAVPGLVMAFGYVAMSLRWPFGPEDPLGGWFDVVGAAPNPLWLLIVAYAVRRLPYVVRTLAAGLEQTPVEFEEAAYNLGAGVRQVMGVIVLPLVVANLIAGALLAFSFSMLEVSDSLILAQKSEHYPITKAIFELYNRLGDGPYIASAMGVWGMALLALTLLGAGLMMGKRMGAIFRV